ncbi:MAG: RES domain-containing protein [Acidimicrobiales bacterium]
MTEAKLPAHPPADLAGRTPDWRVRDPHGVLWAILDTAGAHPRTFGQMRSWGPLRSGRFDPHPAGPPKSTSGELVSYAATTLLTAIAERYQDRRAVTPHDHNRPAAYAWFPQRALHLIDCTSSTAPHRPHRHRRRPSRRLPQDQLRPKNVTRRWARAVRAAWPDADGLLYSTSMTDEPAITLWAPAHSTFGPAPAFSSLISSPAPGLARNTRRRLQRSRLRMDPIERRQRKDGGLFVILKRGWRSVCLGGHRP